MNGPFPSKRAFLSDLASLPPGSKVRFLGCVRTYDISTGHLILEHNYPRSKTGPATVSVDINALLESVTAEVLRVGAWVNVLGYVRDAAYLSRNREDKLAMASEQSVYLEAIMIFSAGPVALGEYERILREAQNVDRRVRMLD